MNTIIVGTSGSGKSFYVLKNIIPFNKNILVISTIPDSDEYKGISAKVIYMPETNILYKKVYTLPLLFWIKKNITLSIFTLKVLFM
jgi:hypothetical protein